MEIGSGNGLVGLFLKKNFDVQYTGIEIDHETSKKAIAFGLNVINSDYKVIQNLSEKFDVIMMWEVLEHIQDLDFCLKLLKKSLSENGRIILSVPNYDKRLNYNNRKDKLYQSGPPIHLNFFTERSLKNTFKYYGYSIDNIRQKKLPYMNFKNPDFLRLIWMKCMGRFQGPTLYLITSA